MKYIPLTRGNFAIVDDENYEWLMRWKWFFGCRGYAARQELDNNGKRITIMMHREVNRTPKGLYTDHINSNRLDNRKCNLRACTNGENQMNRPKTAKSISKYKGVSWHCRDRKWQVRINKNRKRIHIGSFKNVRQEVSRL